MNFFSLKQKKIKFKHTHNPTQVEEFYNKQEEKNLQVDIYIEIVL